MKWTALAMPVALCSLVACGRAGDPGVAASQAPTTFTKDVAPILFERCVTCHRPGQHAVPFSLLTYADAKPRAKRLAEMTKARRMPPWPPDPTIPGFVGERRLSEQEIDTIQRWVAAGAPEGSASNLPKTPVFPEGWLLGQPDLVVSMAKPYTLRPAERDVFRNVVIRVPITADKFVRAVEFDPGHAPIHHAIIRIDPSEGSRNRDGKDGQPGFDGMAAIEVQNPDGHFIGWAPGRGPIVAPEALPWHLVRGSDLVVELHLLPGKTPVAIQPTVAFFFSDKVPEQTPMMAIMGSKAMEIPAGATDYAIEDTYTLPVDVDLLSVYPHAHYLGKTMDVTATLPDGSTRSLLHIKQWSFHWQQDYRYVTPVPLPRGTRLAMKFTYDNSAGNKSNPNKPPKDVTFGPQSSDEMGNLGLQLLPKTRADALIFKKDFARHEAVMNVASNEMFVRHNPDNAWYLSQLGSSYLEVGRLDDAIVQLEKSVRLDPNAAQARNFLGGAYFAQRRGADALVQFRRAVQLAPADAPLHFNLARALHAVGQPAEALRELQRAVALKPDFAEAHEQLGVVLFTAGRLAEAIQHLERAVALAPNSAAAHSDLGGALAQAGRFAEAVARLRRALEIDPTYEDARRNLALLEARIGR